MIYTNKTFIVLTTLLSFFIFLPNSHTISAASPYFRRTTPTPTPIPGFTGQYFNNINLTGTPTLTRIDNQINFDWALTSPDPIVNTDYFSVRWTKTQNFSSGDYKFTLTADDGVRFYIDNTLVLDKWIDQPVTTYEFTQKLTTGSHSLKMEYYDKMYHAVAKLSWTSVSLATPTPTPTTTPVNQTLKWGASAGWSPTEVANFESLVGKPVNYRTLFLAWPDPLPSDVTTPLKSTNKTLLVFWEPYVYSYSDILTGKADNYLTSFAASIKSYGNPVILVPFEEVNDGGYPWAGGVNGNTSAQFIQTFQYVRKFFTNLPNLQFAWNVNTTSPFNPAINQPASYYPGDANVDVIGVDGMNFGNPWESWSEIYSYTLSVVQQYNKPVIIMSVASAPGLEKANWIRQGLGIDIKKYPQVVGWIWFNENKETDWRVNSDPDSLSAFKSVLP